MRRRVHGNESRGRERIGMEAILWAWKGRGKKICTHFTWLTHNGKQASKCTSAVFITTKRWWAAILPKTTPCASMSLERAITQKSSGLKLGGTPDVLCRNILRRISCQCSWTSKYESKVTLARPVWNLYRCCKSFRTNVLSHSSPRHCRRESMRQLFRSPSDIFPGFPCWT